MIRVTVSLTCRAQMVRRAPFVVDTENKLGRDIPSTHTESPRLRRVLVQSCCNMHRCIQRERYASGWVSSSTDCANFNACVRPRRACTTAPRHGGPHHITCKSKQGVTKAQTFKILPGGGRRPEPSRRHGQSLRGVAKLMDTKVTSFKLMDIKVETIG
jgi:hypothetical protein